MTELTKRVTECGFLNMIENLARTSEPENQKTRTSEHQKTPRRRSPWPVNANGYDRRGRWSHSDAALYILHGESLMKHTWAQGGVTYQTGFNAQG